MNTPCNPSIYLSLQLPILPGVCGGVCRMNTPCNPSIYLSKRMVDVCRTDVLASGVLKQIFQNHSMHVCCVCGEPILYRGLLAAWRHDGAGRLPQRRLPAVGRNERSVTHAFCQHCISCIKNAQGAILLDMRSTFNIQWLEYDSTSDGD
jgi:hypothetical protein